jgi:heterotetrameric sarcosine oxidase gamma subunit
MPDIAIPVARTPLHHWHAAHGARFRERDGWQVVAAYADAESEAAAARTGLGLADISASVKVSLRGVGVPYLVQSLLPDSAAQRPLGVATLPGEPALACRLTDDHLLLLASPPAALTLRAVPDAPSTVRTDVTSAYAGFELVGPRLEEALRRLTHLDTRLASFPVNSCAETALAGVEALLVRSAERSLPSLRIYVAWDLGEYVWERLLEAGHDGPILPVGLDALAIL